MIISHKHKFIFVKTKKTAGTSLEIALSKLCGSKDVITRIGPPDEKARIEHANITAQNCHVPLSRYRARDFLKALIGKPPVYYNHITCEEIQRYVSKEHWNSYYKFTIERNPFDKVVSLYFWKRGDEKFASIYDFLSKGGLNGFKSFDIYSVDGVPAVNKIYRYENIPGMCRDLTERLGLSEPLAMPEYKAKSGYRKVIGYREILDEKSIALIRTIFKREIQLLGYEY